MMIFTPKNVGLFASGMGGREELCSPLQISSKASMSSTVWNAMHTVLTKPGYKVICKAFVSLVKASISVRWSAFLVVCLCHHITKTQLHRFSKKKKMESIKRGAGLNMQATQHWKYFTGEKGHFNQSSAREYIRDSSPTLNSQANSKQRIMGQWSTVSISGKSVLASLKDLACHSMEEKTLLSLNVLHGHRPEKRRERRLQTLLSTWW